MSVRPTGALNTAVRWCTTLANRVLPGSEQRTRGFSAVLEDPVPDGVHNYLFGVTSTWVEWVQDWAGSYCGLNTAYFPLGSAAWITRYDGTDALTEIRHRTTESPTTAPGTFVRLASLTGAAGDARWVGSVTMGGTPTVCTLYVDDTDATYSAIVRVYDVSTTPSTPSYVYREWSVTGTSATGAVVLTLAGGSPATLDGPVGIEVIVMPASGGAYVTILGLRLQFSTVDPA